MSLGDTVIVMSQGRIMQEGPPTEIYRNPKTKFVAEFIGRSNWFDGTVRDVVSERVCRFDTRSGPSLLVPTPDDGSSGADSYEVCVRPERININAEAKPGAEQDGMNRLSGTVRDVAHLGPDIHLLVELEGGHLITISEQYHGQGLEQSGEQVELMFRPEDCIIVPATS
jgi:putative spermidine/putrescine transport system ATP-binding protein/putrescine transport system ATP-binding protein